MALGLRKALVSVAGTLSGVGKALVRRRPQDAPDTPGDAPGIETIPLPAPLEPDPERRHVAAAPQALGRRGWMEVAWVLYNDVTRDRLFLIAAGVAFYILLSIFPAISAVVSIYGIFADAKAIIDQMDELAFVLPPGAIDIIRGQAQTIAGNSSGRLSALAVVSLLVALWSANAGMKSMFDAMNLIYGEEEKRTFVALNVQSFLFTLAALGVFLAMVVILLVVPFVLSFIELREKFAAALPLVRWPVLFAVTATFLTLLNRYGPSRHPTEARWAIWGSVFGAAVWIAVSSVFSYYLGHFANYAATYGSLATIAGLMMWLWVSALVILVGVEMNAELEERTLRWEREREFEVATKDALRRREELLATRRTRRV